VLQTDEQFLYDVSTIYGTGIKDVSSVPVLPDAQSMTVLLSSSSSSPSSSSSSPYSSTSSSSSTLSSYSSSYPSSFLFLFFFLPFKLFSSSCSSSSSSSSSSTYVRIGAIFVVISFSLYVKKGKVIPLQARCGPEGG